MWRDWDSTQKLTKCHPCDWSIESDRLFSVRLQFSGLPVSTLSIIGVYLPCIDQGLDSFAECLSELERLICESKRLGPVIVAGDFDFNINLGILGGP